MGFVLVKAETHTLANIFSIESFMDELAWVNRVDPFDFRLAHLSDQRARFVLEKLRELANPAQRTAGGAGKDWSSYPILRFGEIPHVNVEIIKCSDHPWLGVAEAAQGPTSAAIANAIFHARGKRLRDIPLTAAKILAAETSTHHM